MGSEVVDASPSCCDSLLMSGKEQFNYDCQVSPFKVSKYC